MFFSYLKTAFRNIKKDLFYSLINILGLSVGVLSAILIMFYINDEINFDKHYSDYDRIYRLETHFKIQGKEDFFALSQNPLGPTVKDECPEIESYTRVKNAQKLNYKHEENQYSEENFYLADSNYFELFDHKFVHGSAVGALNKPHTVVLTESTAKRYFGDDNPIGKMITHEFGQSFEVTGVIEDIPDNTHLKPDAIISYLTYKVFQGEEQFNSRAPIEFWRVSTYTYVKLYENTNISSALSHWDDIYNKYMQSLEEGLGGGRADIIGTRLDKIHHSPTNYQWDLPRSNFNYVYILFFIGLILVIIAVINYMNLSTARSSKRSKEVALRKVSGATRSSIIQQFLVESVVITLIASLISFVSAYLLLDQFNIISGKNIGPEAFLDQNILIASIVLVLIVGLLSGSYPAFYLSSFQPAIILKSMRNTSKSGILRKILVVAQFTMAVFMITGTLLISEQLDYMRNKPLGFKKENLVEIQLLDTNVTKKYKAIKDQLVQNKNISEVSFGMAAPGSKPGKMLFTVEDPADGSMKESTINFFYIGDNYVNTFGFEVLEGRDFDNEIQSDYQSSILVNESALQSFGWEDEPLGKKISQISLDPNYEVPQWKVIGVLRDFNYGSLHNPVEPIVFFRSPSWLGKLYIRVKDNEIPNTLTEIEETLRDFSYSKPFVYNFVEENLDQFYKAEEKLALIFTIFSIIAIFISCLGLLGLSSFIAEQKTKEIGIRKTLGADTSDIIYQLSKGFIGLVLIGIVISIPLAFKYIDVWLQDFAFKMDISPIPFIISAGLALLVAIITVVYQAYKASLSKPINSLRYE